MTDLSRTPVETREGWFEQYLPAPEACARIKTLARNRQTKRARRIFICVEQRGRTDETHYFPISGNIPTTRSDAIKFVTDAYKGFTERGAVVRLVWCENCLFVG